MGERYLIDTSAYGRYVNRKLDDTFYNFFESVIREESILSVITRMELLSWIPGDKQMEADIRSIIDDSTVLPLSEEIILQTVRLRRHYKSVKLPDTIIAATAIINDFTLLSADDRDFEKIAGLKYKSLSR